MDRDIELEHRVTKLEEAVALIAPMASQVNDISLKFAKYEGRWGSITMIVTVCWAVLATFKDDILRLLRITDGN